LEGCAAILDVANAQTFAAMPKMDVDDYLRDIAGGACSFGRNGPDLVELREPQLQLLE
jgi:hypothetical protein